MPRALLGLVSSNSCPKVHEGIGLPSLWIRAPACIVNHTLSTWDKIFLKSQIGHVIDKGMNSCLRAQLAILAYRTPSLALGCHS